MNGHRGVVGGLLLNRFGQTETLGLSTDRDLFISAIISDIFCVERVVKVPNVEGNIAFFESRRSEQPSVGVQQLSPLSPAPDRRNAAPGKDRG